MSLVDRYWIKDLFDKIKNNKLFQPHPFDEEYIFYLWKGHYENLFYAVRENTEIIGYGFLRGFDEGWDDICLGIYILDRGKGLGELLMNFLHTVAKRQRLERLRLHCHPDNKKALNLYKKMDYEFNGEKHNGELVGFCTL